MRHLTSGAACAMAGAATGPERASAAPVRRNVRRCNALRRTNELSPSGLFDQAYPRWGKHENDNCAALPRCGNAVVFVVRGKIARREGPQWKNAAWAGYHPGSGTRKRAHGAQRMTKTFASSGDLAEKTITFKEIGRDLYAFTAEGDPNSGVIVG